MNIEEIMQEVQEETKAYVAKIQALQDKMPAGFYFQVPRIELYTSLGTRPMFTLNDTDIVRRIL